MLCLTCASVVRSGFSGWKRARTKERMCFGGLTGSTRTGLSTHLYSHVDADSVFRCKGCDGIVSIFSTLRRRRAVRRRMAGCMLTCTPVGTFVQPTIRLTLRHALTGKGDELRYELHLQCYCLFHGDEGKYIKAAQSG